MEYFLSVHLLLCLLLSCTSTWFNKEQLKLCNWYSLQYFDWQLQCLCLANRPMAKKRMEVLTKTTMHRSEIRKHIEADQGSIIINEFFLLLHFSSFLETCQIARKQPNMPFSLWFITLLVGRARGCAEYLEVRTEVKQFVTMYLSNNNNMKLQKKYLEDQ